MLHKGEDPAEHAGIGLLHLLSMLCLVECELDILAFSLAFGTFICPLQVVRLTHPILMWIH